MPRNVGMGLANRLNPVALNFKGYIDNKKRDSTESR